MTSAAFAASGLEINSARQRRLALRKAPLGKLSGAITVIKIKCLGRDLAEKLGELIQRDEDRVLPQHRSALTPSTFRRLSTWQRWIAADLLAPE